MVIRTQIVMTAHPDQYDIDYEGLQCVFTASGPLWLREINCEIYEVHRYTRWFRSPMFSVEKFAGADTAAIGGGAVLYDRVSPEFETEIEAVKFLSDLKVKDLVSR